MPPTTTDAPINLADKRAANEPGPQGGETVDSGDLDAMRGEVAAEPDADDTWPRAIPIGDVTVRVKHYLDWPLTVDDLIATAQITAWAQKILVGDDFDTIWVPADPTLRQGIAFVKAVEVATGLPFAPHLTLPTS